MCPERSSDGGEPQVGTLESAVSVITKGYLSGMAATCTDAPTRGLTCQNDETTRNDSTRLDPCSCAPDVPCPHTSPIPPRAERLRANIERRAARRAAKRAAR